MKKILFLLLAVPAFLFTGCKDDDEHADVLEIVTSDIGFDATGGTGTITLKTSGAAVTATSDKEWLTIDQTTASTVAYTVAGYDGALGRSAQITIASGSLSRNITVLQSGALCEISADPVNVDPAGLKATEIAFSSTAAGLPTVTIPEEVDWLHATVEEDKIVLTGELNLGDPRTTTITVSQSWKPAVEIEVTQKTIALLEAETIETIKADAKEVIIPVSEYMTQIAPDWEVTADAAWITLTKSDTDVTVTLTENDTKATREGSIVVTGAGKTLYTIPVKQGPVNYDFFLGKWSVPAYNMSMQKTVYTLSIAAVPAMPAYGIEAKTTYMITGLASSVLAYYIDDDEAPYLSLLFQALSQTSLFVPLFQDEEGYLDFALEETAGMNFIYKNDQTLDIEDNGAYSSELIGLSIVDLSSGDVEFAGVYLFPSTATRTN